MIVDTNDITIIVNVISVTTIIHCTCSESLAPAIVFHMCKIALACHLMSACMFSNMVTPSTSVNVLIIKAMHTDIETICPL